MGGIFTAVRLWAVHTYGKYTFYLLNSCGKGRKETAMRGPIDFIIVGFEGNKFDGSILRALDDALDKGIIGLVALSVIMKDEDGNVTSVDVSDDLSFSDFLERVQSPENLITEEDILEVADLVENNTSCGPLVIEHRWAIPLKEALIKANGVLIADGRIHPDAAQELNQ